MSYVYILYAPNHDKYYVGQTKDIATRLLFHNELSKTSYTSKYRPWELKKSWKVANESEAVRLERFIKKQKSKKFIIKLLDDVTLFPSICEKMGIVLL